VLLEKPASVYSDQVHHSVSIVAELVSEYGIRGVTASGFSKLQLLVHVSVCSIGRRKVVGLHSTTFALVTPRQLLQAYILDDSGLSRDFPHERPSRSLRF